MKGESQYWFFEWLRRENISSLDGLESAIDRPKSMRSLRSLAEEWRENSVSEALDKGSLLAGSGLDMAFKIDCPTPSCRQGQVDQLFRRAWFYFDKIVVSDALGRSIRLHLDDDDPDELHQKLISIGSALLYIRGLGAENLIDFREKILPPPIKSRPNLKIRKEIDEQYASCLDILLNEGDFSIVEKPGFSPWIEYRHPDVPATGFAEIPENYKSKSYNTIRKWFASETLNRHLQMIGVDVYSARKYKLPLALGVGLHGKLRASMKGKVDPSSVAMSVRLPYLDGLPISELLSLRKIEEDSFLRFRDALRKAVNEGIKNSPSLSPEELARQIEGDILAPAVRNIDKRLRLAERVMAKKVGFSTAIGAMATVCGLLTDIQSLAVGGALGLATMGAAAVGKRKEEQRDIELDDMYFLWKNSGHSHD